MNSTAVAISKDGQASKQRPAADVGDKAATSDVEGKQGVAGGSGGVSRSERDQTMPRSKAVRLPARKTGKSGGPA